MTHRSIKQGHLSAASILALTAWSGSALADCSNPTPTDGETVVCDAAEPNPFPGGIFGGDGVTVNVLTGAGIDAPGSDAISLGANASLSNSGEIDAQFIGFLAETASTISNFGRLTGSQAINIGFVQDADEDGVFETTVGGDIGSLTNAAGGVIEGRFNAIGAVGSIGVLDNAGVIRGLNGSAALAIQGRVGMLTNSNLIEGSVNAAEFSTVTNDGDILGTNAGLAAAGVFDILTGSTSAGSIGSLVNGGVIRGDNGVFVAGGFDAANGIGLGEGRIGALDNSGTITGTRFSGVQADRIETLTNTGVIEGVSDADFATGLRIFDAFGSIDNSGTIFGAFEGVSFGGAGEAESGSLLNRSGGVIRGGGQDAVSGGLIGSIVNEAGALIEGGASGFQGLGVGGRGIQVFNAGSITNAGTIRSLGNDGITILGFDDPIDTDGDGAPDVFPLANVSTGAIVNEASGVIEGFDDGLQVGGVLTSLVNAGVITGGRVNPVGDSPFGLNNSGVSAFGEVADTDGDGVADTSVFDGVIASLVNEAVALIDARGPAVEATRIMSLVNRGAITSDEFGVVAGGLDQAFVAGFEGDALPLLDQNELGLLIENDGVIRGLAGVGLVSGRAEIVNRGLIESFEEGGLAITLGGGDDLVTLAVGGSFGDDFVSGGDGLDTLRLAGSGAQTFNLARLIGFEDVAVQSGDWDLVVEGGTFAMDGVVDGSVTVGAGGFIAPGGSIGTLEITGDLTLSPGAAYLAEVSSAAVTDRLLVGGTAFINDATLVISAFGPDANLLEGDTITLLEAAGGIQGTGFSTVDASDFGFEGLSASFADGVLSVAIPAMAEELLDTPSEDPNVGAVGAGLFEAVTAEDAGSEALAETANEILALPEDERAEALASLSGQGVAEAASGGAEAGAAALDALDIGASDFFDAGLGDDQGGSSAGSGEGGGRGGADGSGLAVGGFGVGASPFFSFGSTRGGDGSSGFDVENRGGSVSFAFRPAKRLLTSLGVGYARLVVEADTGLTRTTSNNINIGLKADWAPKRWRLNVGAAYTNFLDLETRRTIVIGDRVERTRSNPDAFAIAASGRVTWTSDRIDTLGGLRLRPFVFGEWSRYDQEAAVEEGDPGVALALDETEFTSATTGGGLTFSWRVERGRWAVSPSLILGGLYEVGDVQGAAGAQFADAPDGVGEFQSDSASRSDASGRLGFQTLVKPPFLDVSVGLAYDGIYNGQGSNHAIRFRASRDF